MAAAAKARRLYSWWWDSHISPKNSKWLQENLTDMDAKVKQMIKLIEEDADSFARRAEMYYKKRPELMKLVEEFYRAYRALAERYDNATGVLRQAHKTMSEAQLPLMLSDDTASELDPQTPEMSFPVRTSFDSDRKNGAFTEDSDSGPGKKGLKQFNSMFGSARRGLNFHDAEEKDGPQSSGKAEAEILNLKKDLAKLEAEKEASLLQYQQSMERVSNLEVEVSRAQEDSKQFNERAKQAESEVQSMKDALAKLEDEKNASLLQYQQCLDKLTELQEGISVTQKDAQENGERASKAETEIETLKQDLLKIEGEKEAAHAQYRHCLEVISELEDKLKHAEEDAKKLMERAINAESEVESLKEALAKLTEEKEAIALQCHQCLEKITDLENKLSTEIEKLRLAEERCLLLETSNQTMHTELESLTQKVGDQSQELVEKQTELGNLWACIQEERLRFVEAETAFQTLQHLHSQSQEELRSLAAQIQNRNQMLKDMEDRNQSLQDEVLKASDENKHLNELNMSSSLTIKDLKEEITSLREMIQKLDQEIELRVDQRNALQQEIYCLKEELSDLNKKNRDLLDQVDLVGLDPECFGQSVKELQGDHLKLKEMHQLEKSEKAVLLEKLGIMEELIQKNVLLENSLSDLNVELEGVREKVKTLEESYESLLVEKSAVVAEKDSLASQLQIMTQTVEKLSEKNSFLENLLSDANSEVEVLKVKSKTLEDSCVLLGSEKMGLASERENLTSQLDVSQQSLKELEKRYRELEEIHMFVEKERQSILSDMTKLRDELHDERQQHESFAQLSKSQFADMESRILLLQQEVTLRNNDYGEELDKNMISQVEIFILQKCIQELKDNFVSLGLDCEKLLEASKCSEKQITCLENQKLDQLLELKSLTDQINELRLGLYQMLKMLDVNAKNGFEPYFEHNKNPVEHIIWKMKELQNSFAMTRDENLLAAIEKSITDTLLRQMELDAADLCTERNMLDQSHKAKCEQLILLQKEAEETLNISEKLRLLVLEGLCREEVLKSELKILHERLVDSEASFQNLKEENSEVFEEKRRLMNEILLLTEEKCQLEEENRAIFCETVSQATFSLILKHNALQRYLELKELTKDLERLNLVNTDLHEKLKVTECLVEKSENEVTSFRSVNEQLNSEIENGKEMLNQLEKKLSDAKLTIATIENEKQALQKEIEDLKIENGDIKVIQDNQSKEIESLHEMKLELEVKLVKLLEENGELVILEKNLSNDIEQWEVQAAAFLGRLIISEVREMLLEEKLHEVNEASYSSSESKREEIEVLEKRVSTLEVENGQLNAKMAAYVSTLLSLEDCVASLENSIGTDKSSNANGEEAKDAGLMTEPPANSHAEADVPIVLRASSEMHDLLPRMRAIEKALLDREQENSNTNAKLVAAMEEIDKLKSKPSSDLENEPTEKIGDSLTKDIVLDQVSECSSYGISRRGTIEADDQMLELWETVEKPTGAELRKEHRSLNPSAESLSEISESFTEQGGGKRKVLERLDSDAQKLTNLQITVEDLKRKVETTEQSTKGKGLEYGTVKGQLEEAESAILKLFDANRELVKNIEDGAQTKAGNDSGNISRRRISEQARRGSEKIGRLQLELQKIQFLLLKLDGGKDIKERSARLMTDRNARVLLRDYLYGGGRNNHRQHQKRKKSPFCGCAPKVIE